MIDSPDNLTPAGRARKEAILQRALRDASELRYGHIERRLGVALAVLFVGAAALLVYHQPPPTILKIAAVQRSLAKPEPMPVVLPDRIKIVRTDPYILERLSVAPEPPRWTVIGDDELLATLSESGHPAGLIECNGQTRIVFR